MTKNRKMLCPDCGVLMNWHAEKIDYAAALDGAEAFDPDFGGVIEEAQTCPACGQTQLRRQSSETGTE